MFIGKDFDRTQHIKLIDLVIIALNIIHFAINSRYEYLQSNCEYLKIFLSIDKIDNVMSKTFMFHVHK